MEWNGREGKGREGGYTGLSCRSACYLQHTKRLLISQVVRLFFSSINNSHYVTSSTGK